MLSPGIGRSSFWSDEKSEFQLHVVMEPQLPVTVNANPDADAVTVYNQSEDEAAMPKTATRDREREDDLLAASKAMTPEQRLEAAARLSAIAFQFHLAGLAYRKNLRVANGSVDDDKGEGKREA
jgi:hypothetical protein